MKKYYGLIGTEVELEEWVLSYKDLVPTLPKIEAFEKMLTASSWPVLFYEQIPERFLVKNPGFPLLLRKEVSHKTPDWIFRPCLPSTENYSGRYLIKTISPLRKPKRILFSVAHAEKSNWDELCRRFPADEHRWIWNTNENSIPSSLQLPSIKHCGMGEIIHEKIFSPDMLIDLSFGLSDTYTPIHLHLLHRGCDLKHFMDAENNEVLMSKDRGQARWLIFK